MSGTDTRDPVLLDVDEGVGLLTLNRPQRLNAMTDALLNRLLERFEEVAARSDVRVVVLTGAGRGFCAGVDLALLDDIGTGERAVTMPGTAYLVARSIPKPVIAAVNGPCLGLGLVFALTCDLRFASTSARFGTAFAHVGLVAEQGLAWLLPRVIGPARALDLLLSARIAEADEALRLGLVQQVHDDGAVLEETLRYARGLAAHSSPASMGAIKWQVQRGMETTLEQAIDDADPLTRASLHGPDFVEVGSRRKPGELPEFPPLPATSPRLGPEPPVGLVAGPRRAP